MSKVGAVRRKSTAREAGGGKKTTGAVGAPPEGVRPLPDSHEDRRVGMMTYIIALKEAEPQPDAAPMGRRELYETGVAHTAAFRRKLAELLEAEHLSSQVADIGEPTMFSLTSLTSTPRVAQRIERLPEVEYVVPDSEDVGIVR